MRLPFLALLLCLAASLARADSGWLLMTADFDSKSVDLTAIDEKGIQVTAAGTPRTVNYKDFLELHRSGASRPSTDPFTLYLAGGDVLYGEPRGIKDEKIQWKSSSVGELLIPLRDVRAMLAKGRKSEGLEAARTEDAISMTNGDSVKGIVSAMEPGKITIQVQSNPVEVPLNTVNEVFFAAPAQKLQAPARAFRVSLLDGSIFTAPSAVTKDDQLVLKLANGQERQVPLASVISIEQLNGPVSWLSARIPTSTLHVPYSSETLFPPRMDKNYRGNPLRFGKTVYSRGIGVHSKSVVVFDIPPDYIAFRTQYAIDTDDANDKADVTVRILLDSEVAHEKEHFRAGTLAPVLVIETKGHKTLTLEVDYGANMDTQDRFNWIEPALLKDIPPPPPPPPPPPATAPATAPATTRATTGPTTAAATAPATAPVAPPVAPPPAAP